MKTLDLDVLILTSTFFIMQTNNTNYINGWGCIRTHEHSSLNYGQTGKYSTDASTPKGYVHFAASLDDDFVRPAALVKIKDIHTHESTYANGLES